MNYLYTHLMYIYEATNNVCLVVHVEEFDTNNVHFDSIDWTPIINYRIES